MDDRTLKRKLNQLTKIANELAVEAERRWPDGTLFYDDGGSFHVMSGDCDPDRGNRQHYIEFSSDGYCRLSAGVF